MDGPQNEHPVWLILVRNSAFLGNQPLLNTLAQTCRHLRQTVSYESVVMHLHTTLQKVESVAHFLAYRQLHHPSTLTSVSLSIHSVVDDSNVGTTLSQYPELRSFTWRDLDISCSYDTAAALLSLQTPSMLTRLSVRTHDIDDDDVEIVPADIPINVARFTGLVSLHLFTTMYTWGNGFGSHLTELKLHHYLYDKSPPLPVSLVSFVTTHFFRKMGEPVYLGHLTKLTSLNGMDLWLEPHDVLPPNLQGFTFCHCVGNTDAAYLTPLTGISSLKELTATNWYPSQEQADIIKGLTHITAFGLGVLGNMPPANLQLTGIHALSLSTCSLVPRVRSFVCSLTQLRSLSFECIGSSADITSFVACITGLTTLHTLHVYQQMSLRAFGRLCRDIKTCLPKLTHLSLPPIPINIDLESPEVMRAKAALKICVHGLPDLKFLAIQRNRLSCDELCALLEPCYKLEVLDMSGCTYAASGFRYDRIALAKLLAMTKPPYQLKQVSFDPVMPLQLLHDHGFRQLKS